MERHVPPLKGLASKDATTQHSAFGSVLGYLVAVPRSGTLLSRRALGSQH